MGSAVVWVSILNKQDSILKLTAYLGVKRYTDFLPIGLLVSI